MSAEAPAQPAAAARVAPLGWGREAPAASLPYLGQHLAVIYGLMHAAVDASTVMVVMSAAPIHRLTLHQAFYLIVSYDVLAFGSQAFFGLLVDKLRAPRAATVAGLAFAFAGVLALGAEPLTAMILVSLGNALFHIGAGAITLCINPHKAAAPGIFVAPGALGLGLGIYLGKIGGPAAIWPFLVALGLALVVTLLLTHPVVYRPASVHPPAERPPRAPAEAGSARSLATVIVSLLLFSIVIRSLVGMVGGRALPKGTEVLCGLTIAAFGGKLLGGLISDRIGWIETSVGALLLSAPFLAFGGSNLTAIMIGLLLFQMTMPVTLSATALIFRNRPAFAFGLCCLALVLGALPTFYQAVKRSFDHFLILGLIGLSALAVYWALRLMGNRNPGQGFLTRPPAGRHRPVALLP